MEEGETMNAMYARESLELTFICTFFSFTKGGVLFINFVRFAAT